MRLLFSVVIFYASIAAVCSASDETLARGLPGSYAHSSGMYSESLSLKSDGTYTFGIQWDVGRDEESGTWSVRDSVVILAVKKRGESIKQRSTRFLALAVDGDLALRVQDGDYQSADELDPRLLFRREKTG